MPNWCSNELVVAGPRDVLARFRTAGRGQGSVRETELSLQALYPCPESLLTVQAGSEENLLDLFFGDISRFADYSWLPDAAKGDRDALIQAFAKAWGRTPDELRAAAEQYQKNKQEHGHATWYRWQIAHWGTEWDLSDVHLLDEELGADESTSAVESGADAGSMTSSAGLLRYEFETAWSPPEAAFEKIAADYPELTFTLSYYESGMGFAGTCSWEQGVQTEAMGWHGDERQALLDDEDLCPFAARMYYAQMHCECGRMYNEYGECPFCDASAIEKLALGEDDDISTMEDDDIRE